MTDLQLTIPAQDSERRGMRLKPREVREWLHNLPYMDVSRTLQLVNQQLRLLNRQVIAPAARLEILDDFLATYQRLLETAPTDATAAAEVKPLLKKLCQNIGFGYKILVHTLVNGKGGFLDARHLPQAMLGAIHTLGQQLIHYYASYQRVPRSVWSECLTIYRHAQHARRADYVGRLAGTSALGIEPSFRLIALLKLTDPYQLLPGMLEVLQQYFRTHIDLSSMLAGSSGGSELRLHVTAGQHRLPHEDDSLSIDVTKLLTQMQLDITRLEQRKHALVAGLSRNTPPATLLLALQKTLQHWQARRERKTERDAAAIGIDLVVGLETAYCVINRNRAFDPAMYLTGSEDNNIDIGMHGKPEAAARQQPAATIHCSTVNRNSGGLGISYRGKAQAPRVGQLLAVRRAAPNAGGWVLGVFRWLVEPESVTGFDAGLQYLTGEPEAVVIRPFDAGGFGGDYQPALTAVQKRGEQRVQTLVARSKELRPGDAFAIYDERGVQRRARCSELLEAGTGFDRFIYELLS